ncbi:hypothetical protein BLNAU_12414 [Blattamonas nauphoetae]|uniref:FAR1 domain-containing protein n=1 Tax=Blattamonas nauphoetae TaxID=2049346 RepID=A0ABQ9XQN4_9EUKA|nr:hypothetical protein BLNAU_12414 [Blattamonas nauphoetae]
MDDESSESLSDTEETLTLLDPPPTATFQSLDSAKEYSKQFALKHGYVLTVISKKKNGTTYLGCKHANHYKLAADDEDKIEKRKRQTSCLDCQFQIKISLKDGLWVTQWNNKTHNHEAPDSMCKYHEARVRKEEETAKLQRKM